ncbi:hypothetical protein B5M09_005706, partial [Aphanomyces astaci]
HEAALDAQPVSAARWGCLHAPPTTGSILAIDGATTTADTSECTNVAAIGWRPHRSATRTYSIQIIDPVTDQTWPFRVGWTTLHCEHLSVLLGDDAASMGFDGTSMYFDYHVLGSLPTPVPATWRQVSCILDLDQNTLTFAIEEQSTLRVPLPPALREESLVPGVGIGRRSFRSSLFTRVLRLRGVPEPGRVYQARTLSFLVYPLATQDNCEPHPWRTICLKGQDQTMKRTASVFLSCDRLLLAVCVSTKSDWNSTLVSTGPVSANQWTHVAIVCDNVTLRLYIQGKEDRTLSLNDVVTTIRSVSSPPGVKKASTDYKGFRGYLQHMLLYPTTRAWMAKDVAKYVKERKPSVDSTDLSCARPPLSNPVTPSHMDSPDVVTYFSPSSDEFHMQVTVPLMAPWAGDIAETTHYTVVVSSGAVWTHVLTFVLLLRHAFEKDVDTQGGQPIVALLRILRANFQPLSSVLSTDVAVPCLACPPPVGGDVQLWHVLVHHVPTTAIAVVESSSCLYESSLVQQVALLQNQVLCSMPRDGTLRS